jgi:4-amino-4-deoxy-L-arabinose transferase-like glycosyltransferase
LKRWANLNRPSGTVSAALMNMCVRAEGRKRNGGESRLHAGATGALLVVIGALAVRLVCAYETREVPTIWHLVGDAAGYYRWAQDIAGGEWLGTKPFYQAPLYPYVLAGCFQALGDGVWTIRVVQAVWGAAACGLVYVGTRRLFGTGAGRIAGIMLALYGPAIYFDGIVQKASLTCLLVCGLFAATTWYGEQGSRRAAGALGAAAGLLAITRENAMVWLPVLGLWVWRGEGNCRLSIGNAGASKRRNAETPKRQKTAAIGAYLVGIAVVLMPVGLRNLAVSGEWSVSTFQAGPNFYIGNHRGADGRYQPLVRGHETPEFERDDATVLAQNATGRTLSARAVSRYWMGRAFDDIRGDPSGWVRLMGRKMLMVWNRYEVSDAESPYLYGESSLILGVLGRVWNFGVLCPLAAVGIVGTWGERRRLWVYYALIVSMAVAVAAFYVLGRYRYPLAPLLIPFAAAGCVGLWDRWRGGDLRRLLLPTAVAAGVAMVVNWPVHDERKLNAMARMNVGVALAEAGELPAAESHFRRALADHPQSAEGHNNLAQALALREDFTGAIEHYQAALAVEPGLIGVDFNLGVALERVGRIEEALRAYERAATGDPSDAEARNAAARLRHR